MVLFRFFVRPFAFMAFAAFILCAANLVAAPVNPVPFVNQPLVPTSVAPGSPELALTVNGTGFVSTSVVNWNGTPLTTAFVSSHQLVADVPASVLAAASTASVTVSSPAPGGGTSNAVLFMITNPTTSLAFASSTIPVGLNPGGVIAADFNNDGKADLAVLNQDQPDSNCYHYSGAGTISILLGNGDGTFSNKSTLCFADDLGTVGEPEFLAGDFNGDGNLDLIVSYYVRGDGRANAEIFLGNGDGTFTQGVESLLPEFDYLNPATAGDFNGDGKLDFVIPYADDFGFNNIGILFGNGDGTFTNFGGVASCNNGPPCLDSNAVVTGDFNGDGILDLASVFGGSVTILLGNGDGTFTPSASQPSATLVDAAWVTTADFNGDGILDLAIADAGSTALTILQGNGDGTFTQVSGEPILSQSSYFVTAADVNGDGKLDLVFTGANTVSVYLGNGDGTFHAGLVKANQDASYGVAFGDFNGDGRLDLAVPNSSNNTVSILLQKPAGLGATVTLVSGQSPTFVDQSVTFTAFVLGSPTAPTGSVTFKQGSTILGTVPLANGQASFTTTFTKAGTFSIVASYSGDPHYPAKNSTIVKQVVNKYATGAFLESDLNPSVYGRVVILTCTVYSGAPNPPTGTLTFYNGTSPLGTVSSSNGSAFFLLKASLPAGTFSITATYNGDASNNKSTSNTVVQVVSQATTTTRVTSSRNPSIAGRSVTFTATVNSPTVIPVGTVTFAAGTATLGTVSLEGGKARLTTSALPSGTTTVTATYSGTSNISGSSGSMAQTVK
jgi:hypothetical protein